MSIQATPDLLAEVKLSIGPLIENIFCSDFDVAKPFQPEDLQHWAFPSLDAANWEQGSEPSSSNWSTSK